LYRFSISSGRAPRCIEGSIQLNDGRLAECGDEQLKRTGSVLLKHGNIGGLRYQLPKAARGKRGGAGAACGVAAATAAQ